MVKSSGYGFAGIC